MWMSYLFALSLSLATADCPAEVTIDPGGDSAAHVHGAQHRATSANFQVLSDTIDARDVARLCEDARSSLEKTWSADAPLPNWSPQCDVIVHATRASYSAAIGRESRSTVGSSWIRFAGGRIKERRINLIAERQQLPALPHELTHIVMADLFGGQQPPPWADEGTALLSDSLLKRRLHEQDLQRAQLQHATWPVYSLLSRKCHPPLAAFPTFYAQSASLTAFLVRRGSPSQFVRFVKKAQAGSYDLALAAEYSIDGVAELERLWKSQVPLQVTLLEEPTSAGQ
jgi:hypothetical protein